MNSLGARWSSKERVSGMSQRNSVIPAKPYLIGKGAASGKYAIVASIGNLPVVYMTALNGWAYDYWNASGMLYFEAAITILAIALGLVGLHLVRRTLSSDLSDVASDTL